MYKSEKCGIIKELLLRVDRYRGILNASYL
jgi:hypothetical protein